MQPLWGIPLEFYAFPAVVPAAAQVLRLRGVGEITRLWVPLGGDAGAAHLLLGVGFIKGFRA
jgi:hypothetical protein